MSRPVHRWNVLIRSYERATQDNGESLNAARNTIIILATPTLPSVKKVVHNTKVDDMQLPQNSKLEERTRQMTWPLCQTRKRAGR